MWSLVAATAAAALGVALAARLLGEPEPVGELSRQEVSGLGIQGGIAEFLLRSGGMSSRTEPIVLQEAELNAFLQRHLDGRRLIARPLHVRAGGGWLDVMGRTSLRRVTAPDSGARRFLPEPLLDLEFWLRIQGRVTVTAGTLELIAERTAIGRQPVPRSWLQALPGLAARDLTWRLPPIVERVVAEPGRVVIHTRARRR
jgi:hypothetical protein